MSKSHRFANHDNRHVWSMLTPRKSLIPFLKMCSYTRRVSEAVSNEAKNWFTETNVKQVPQKI